MCTDFSTAGKRRGLRGKTFPGAHLPCVYAIIQRFFPNEPLAGTMAYLGLAAKQDVAIHENVKGFPDKLYEGALPQRLA